MTESPPPRETVDLREWWRNREWLTKVCIVVGVPAVAIAILIGAVRDSSAPPTSSDPVQPVVHQPHVRLPQTVTVTYELTGSARSADITYETPTGSSQQNHVGVPLMDRSHGLGIKFEFPGSATFLYLSAQNNGGGTITCWIKVDGTTLSHNTARGAYAIATCSV